MPVCPACNRPADELHQLPPEVITTDLVAAVEGAESPTDISTCVDCLESLMSGQPLP